MSSRSGFLNGLGLRRFGALVADIVAAGVIGIVLMLPFGEHPGMHHDVAERLVLAVGNAVLYGLYVVPFLVRDGTTPGKRLAGLRVVMADGGGVPSLGVAVLRDPVLKLLVFNSILSVIHPLLGFLTLAIDLAPAWRHRDGSTLHDRLAGTVVVDTHGTG
jgi:uncharacterized RDD family membrane protein YckC